MCVCMQDHLHIALGAGNQTTGWKVERDCCGWKRGSRAYLAGYMARTQFYPGSKGGKGTPCPLVLGQ